MEEKEIEKKVETTTQTTYNDTTDIKRTAYLGFRYLEGLCIAIFVFGLLWEGTEIFDLSTPEFLIVYGGAGAVITELLSRLTQKQIKKK